MAISLKGLKVNDAFEKMPFWCLMLIINLLCLLERKKESGTRMLDLLPTLTADMQMAIAFDSKYMRYAACKFPILLMAGSKSPAYFHLGVKTLGEILTDQQTIIFEGFDHYSPEEKVNEISETLSQFFLH
jgi:hypothetical protein